MERPLLFLERVLYGDGRDPFNGVFALRLRGEVCELRLRMALNKVQDKHPELRTGIVTWGRNESWFKVRPAVDKIGLLVTDRKGDTDWMDAVKDAWAVTFNTKKGPLVKLQLLKGDPSSELIFTFHHCICDGGGGLIIVRDLLMLLDDPDKDIGRIAGFTKLEHIIPQTVRTSRRQRLRVCTIAMLVRFALSVSAVFVSTKHKNRIARSEDYLLHRKFTGEWSSGLFAACSARGVTVNSVLCLAFLLAFRRVRGEKAFNKVTCPVDIRRFLPQLDKESLFSFGLVLTLKAGRIENGTFWDLAKSVQKESERQINQMRPYDFLMVMENLHPALDNMLKTLTYGKVSNDLMFSNMGKLNVQQHYTNFEVESIFSPTVIGPFANPTTVITSTYNGQLDLCFVSNQHYLDRREATEILTLAIEYLDGAISEVD